VPQRKVKAQNPGCCSKRVAPEIIAAMLGSGEFFGQV
jgi:hypothetical protein